MNRPVSAVLKDARALIASPEQWTTRIEARDENDEPCTCFSLQAVKWDLTGAVRKAAVNRKAFPDANRYLVDAVYARTQRAVTAAWWQDDQEHSDVLSLLDDAIKRAEEDEANR